MQIKGIEQLALLFIKILRVVLILLCNGFNTNDTKNMCFYWDLCQKSQAKLL